MGNENLKNVCNDMYLRVMSVYDSLKIAEKKAADYLIEHPHEIATITLVDASDIVGCSEATFVRLAQRMKYSGFAELKRSLKKIDNYSNIVRTEKGSHVDVYAQVFESAIYAIESTMKFIDYEQYDRAVDALLQAKEVVTVGVGDSATVSKSIHNKLLRIGFNIRNPIDIDLQFIEASNMVKDDVLFIVSHSGETKSMFDLIRYVKTLGVKVVCITNFPMSRIARNSDIVLLTAAFESHINDEIMAKRITQLCIVESLYVKILSKKGNQFIECMNKADRSIKHNKLT